jgi:hypothetical protein
MKTRAFPHRAARWLLGLPLLAVAGSIAAQNGTAASSKKFHTQQLAGQQVAPVQAVTASAVADSAATYTRDVQTKVNRSLLEAGKVTAIESGRNVVVDDVSLKARAARREVFYEFARPAAKVAVVPDVLKQPGTAQATLLREDVIVPTSAGASTRLQTYVRDETGLSYVGARNQFEGRFAVALSPADPDGSVTLGDPKKMSVELPGGALISPTPDVLITKVDDWTPVTYSVKQPGKAYHISVSASTSDHSDPVEVKVNPPSINLTTDQPSVPGYGLGTFTVSVSAPALNEPKGAQIALQPDGGVAESGNIVTLDEQGIGQLRMRSIGSGKVTIRALPPFDASFIEVTFKNPLLLLALAMLGGIVGAAATRKGRTKWSKVIRNGALTGLGMAVLYFVGLDWVVRATGFTTLASAGEAVAFALGLLGFLVGFGVVTAVSKKE